MTIRMTTVPDPDRGHDWIDTGPQEVLPGITRVPLPMPDAGLQAVNVYVIVDGDGLVLIDSGWQSAETTARLGDGLRASGFALADVRLILATHVHRDHYSEALTIRRLAGAHVGLSEGERPNIEALLFRTQQDLQYDYFQLIRAHGGDDVVEHFAEGNFQASGFAGGAWEPPDIWLKPGTVDLEERQLRVIPTPGHTRGHVVFLDTADNVLFAGDHVLPHITPSIGLQPAMTALPLADYLNSLDLMLSMSDTALLPAHGYPAPSVHRRVRELIAHHDTRLEAVRTVLATPDGRSLTAREIAPELPWTSRGRSFSELNPFHQALAIAETAAHLDVLETRGVATRRDVEGHFVYAAIGHREATHEAQEDA
jgi:glyoxylase-like metal-dependent hydrolase (beta-lactamase superfamily II)